MIIVSDGAGQFALLLHALCWVHAQLKQFRENPMSAVSTELETRFGGIFTRKTRFQTLNQLLKRVHRCKTELLQVLSHPQIPLHNNLSERDIREHVKKRKISEGTRNNLGRQCRDAFTRLKKTCRKHGISFWNYLGEHLKHSATIP